MGLLSFFGQGGEEEGGSQQFAGEVKKGKKRKRSRFGQSGGKNKEHVVLREDHAESGVRSRKKGKGKALEGVRGIPVSRGERKRLKFCRCSR